MKKLLLLLVLPFLFTANAFSQKYAEYQDVVYLKNGSIIRGIIIEQIPSQSLKIRSSINIGSGFGMWILIDEGNYSHFGFTINFLNVGFLF